MNEVRRSSCHKDKALPPGSALFSENMNDSFAGFRFYKLKVNLEIHDKEDP